MNDARPTPGERFDTEVAPFSLNSIAHELLELARTADHGRAQRTLDRVGPATIAMFAFRADASLPDHAANATVTIQAQVGTVEVNAADRRFELDPGDLLRLKPTIVHAVRAWTDAAILVHILASPNAPAVPTS